MEATKFFIFATSFALTIFFFYLLVRRASSQNRIYWKIGCTVAAILWLGLTKGLVASLIAIALSSERLAVIKDARRIGKRIADSMGIGHNLFFTALELSLPSYLVMLAALEREGEGLIQARATVLPFLTLGFNALQDKFGPQPKTTAAMSIVERFTIELTNSPSSNQG